MTGSDPNYTTPLSASARVRPTQRNAVLGAVAEGARRTDTNFEYLLAQARLESGLRPNAKARTSSATGLFQFIESTWLATMKRHGPSLGYGDVAANIQRSGNRHYVADPSARRAILNLRKDPEIASIMAGALAQDNRNAIAPVLGREPEATELYMAHFLGAGDAKRFLSELYRNPSQSAAALFPKPASANQSIFYHRNGASRDLAGVMDLMQGKMSRAIAANGRMNLPLVPSVPNYQPWIEPSTEGLFGDEGYAPYGRRASRMIAPNDALNTSLPYAPEMQRIGPPPPAPELPPRPPMSDLLRQSFSISAEGSEAPGQAQVRRAYANLKALGL